MRYWTKKISLMTGLAIGLMVSSPSRACMALAADLAYSPGDKPTVLSEPNEQKLSQFATSYLAAGATVSVRVVAHFDISMNAPRNMALAHVRAKTVQLFLLSHGVPESMLRVVLLGEALDKTPASSFAVRVFEAETRPTTTQLEPSPAC